MSEPSARLDLHRGLRPHEALAPVEVGAEAHALLLDRDDHRLAAVAAALDLLGHRAVSHREDLVAAGVGDDRPPPAHELVQAAHLLDQLGLGLDEEVEGVAEHHVVAELGHLGGVQRLDRRRRRERHERGRANVAVRGVDQARAGVAVAGVDAEGATRSATRREPERPPRHLGRLLKPQQLERRSARRPRGCRPRAARRRRRSRRAAPGSSSGRCSGCRPARACGRRCRGRR